MVPRAARRCGRGKSLQAPPVVLLQQRPDRRVQLIERVEGAIPQRRVDALIGQPYRVLDQRLVACLTDAGGHDHYPIVLRRTHRTVALMPGS